MSRDDHQVKLDRRSVIGLAVTYFLVISYWALCVFGVLPEFSIEFGRRHTISVITDEALLVLFLLIGAAGVLTWAFRVYGPTIEGIFTRD